ncbi:MAG: hypothetical protein IAC77_00105 [Proteobacteria bacterium]|uniref:Glycerol-3-phosphate dehydrogenase n=1 Tax=Candidatus Enterousia excrementavium TaxID=2840789 RepID=A0A940DDW9_9PROT|nr:hypothetical protein [Candidatus Enterousia excrementavium]
MKVAVIGAGAWGTALSIVSARGGADVMLWSYDGEYKHFDNVEMPENIQVSTDLEVVGDCDTWLIVTPAAFFRETMRKASTFYNNQPVIVCTKGAESTTGNFMSEIIADELPNIKDFGVLSGPQFAAEVAAGVPTGSTLAGTQRAIDAGRAVLNKLYIHPSDDVIGTEICGVGKNAVALICGYNSVAAAGENERALIFTRAWNEVMEIGLRSGAKMHSFLDLCGIGDLFLSATSATSRNFAGGMAIANGMPPSGTVEGIFALDGLIRRAENVGVDVPTLREMQIKLGLKK